MRKRYSDALPVGVFVLGEDRKIRYWNHWLMERTGIDEADALGKTLLELFPGFRNPRFESAVQQVIRRGGPQILSQALHQYLIPIEQPHLARHGLGLMRQHIHLEPCQEKTEVVAVVTVIDVTGGVLRAEALTNVAQRLESDVNRDPLTGLFNRRFMWEWLEHQFKQALRYEYGIAALMVDLDLFKQINDTLGHHVGDDVLQSFAIHLGICVRDSDVVVRFGGEEFLVLLPRCHRELACEVAHRIVEQTAAASFAGLKAGEVTCSIGMALFDRDQAVLPTDLLQNADKVLYQAKSEGRNRVICEQADH